MKKSRSLIALGLAGSLFGEAAQRPQFSEPPREMVALVPDLHHPLPNADVAAAYEIAESATAPVIVILGDDIDIEALVKTDPAYLMEYICVLDSFNRRQLEGATVIRFAGNHDPTKALEDVMERARALGFNFALGAIVVMPGGRKLGLIHGHQLDSELVLNLAQHGAEQYQKTAEEDPDSATAGKTTIKQGMETLGYGASRSNAARKMGVDEIGTGHTHQGHDYNYYDPPFESLRTHDYRAEFLRAVEIGKIQGLMLAHNAGITPHFTRAVLANEKAINWMARKAPWVPYIKNLQNLIPNFRADPDLKLFDGASLATLKPKFSEEGHSTLKKIYGEIKFHDFGAVIDGLAQYGYVNNKGEILKRDLKNYDDRAELGLAPIPPERDDIIASHMRKYGGLLEGTLDQLKFILDKKGLNRMPDFQEVCKMAELPAADQSWKIKIHENGMCKATPPAGVTAARGLDKTHVSPRQLLERLETIDPRISDNLRERMQGSSELRTMFRPWREGEYFEKLCVA